MASKKKVNCRDCEAICTWEGKLSECHTIKCPGSMCLPDEGNLIYDDEGTCAECDCLVGLFEEKPGNMVVNTHWVNVAGYCHGLTNAPTSTEDVKKEKKKVLRQEEIKEMKAEWSKNYSESLQKAFDYKTDAEFQVDSTRCRKLQRKSRKGEENVVCFVDPQWKVTDFASFVEGVFFIGVPKARTITLTDKIVESINTQSSKSKHCPKTMLKRCKEILEEKRQWIEVPLPAYPDMPAWNMKVFMLDAYGVKNLSQGGHTNPQLMNDRNFRIRDELKSNKEARGVQFLYESWQAYSYKHPKRTSKGGDDEKEKEEEADKQEVKKEKGAEKQEVKKEKGAEKQEVKKKKGADKQEVKKEKGADKQEVKKEKGAEKQEVKKEKP